MIADPTAGQIVDAVRAWLGGEEEAAPGGFARRVARNALDIVARELALAPAAETTARERLRAILEQDGPLVALEQELIARLRAGTLAPTDPALLAHLRADALARIAIDQPRYAHELA